MKKILYNLLVINKKAKNLKVNKIMKIKVKMITLKLIKLKLRNKTNMKSKDKTLVEILF